MGGTGQNARCGSWLAPDQGREPLTRQDFNPVAIWVLDKREPLHLAIIRALDELHAMRLKTVTRRLHVGNANADVSKPPRILVTVMVGSVRVILRAIVMCQFKQRRLLK